MREQRRLKELKEEQEYMQIIAQANHIQLRPATVAMGASVGKKGQ